MIYNTEGQ